MKKAIITALIGILVAIGFAAASSGAIQAKDITWGVGSSSGQVQAKDITWGVTQPK